MLPKALIRPAGHATPSLLPHPLAAPFSPIGGLKLVIMIAATNIEEWGGYDSFPDNNTVVLSVFWVQYDDFTMIFLFLVSTCKRTL